MGSVAENYDLCVKAAGRVNLIGEHVDYCGGKVLPAALSVGNTIKIRKNKTGRINLSWTDIPDTISLDLGDLEQYKGVKYANYFAACARVLQHDGITIPGCAVLSDCTVPFGSGLSSSAAIEVSFIAALSTLAGKPLEDVDVAIAAYRAERHYVGMNCGIMDQYASACGRKGHAMLLDCATLICDHIPVELGDYLLVLANSNKPHSLVVSKYNDRRRESEEALALLQQRYPALERLAEVTKEEFLSAESTLPPVLQRRARHVVFECERVTQAVKAMKSGDILTLGALLRESHRSLKELYEVTGKELDALADAANAFPGCAGSRMTGGGFGGSTVSLVQKDAVRDFECFVAKRYTDAVGYSPTFTLAEISDGITFYD